MSVANEYLKSLLEALDPGAEAGTGDYKDITIVGKEKTHPDQAGDENDYIEGDELEIDEYNDDDSEAEEFEGDGPELDGYDDDGFDNLDLDEK